MKHGLNIAVVTDTYPPELNGVALCIRRVVRHLRGRGHHVRMVRPRQSSDIPDDRTLLVTGLPLPRYPGLQFGLPAWGRLLKQWRRERPDVVHIVTEGPLGWSALIVARQLGIPVTSDYRTNFQTYSRFYRLGALAGVIGGALRSFHNRTDLTFVPTRDMEHRLSQDGYRHLVCVGRGVDNVLFHPQLRSPELRAAWGAGPTDPVVIHVGRLAPEKNPWLVREAFAAIRAEHPGARLVWVGDGPLRDRLDDGSPGEIFAGVRRGTDLAEHYASADLFLFPSTSETFGNVVAEAMASGLAIVAYDLAAAHEHLVDGISARLLPPPSRDDDPLARALFIDAARALAGQPDERRALGVAAWRLAAGLAWPIVLNRFESILVVCAVKRGATGRVAAAV